MPWKCFSQEMVGNLTTNNYWGFVSTVFVNMLIFPLFFCKKDFQKLVCDWLAKWLVVLGFMDLRWPRVYRCSNAPLVCLAIAYFQKKRLPGWAKFCRLNASGPPLSWLFFVHTPPNTVFWSLICRAGICRELAHMIEFKFSELNL